MDTTALITDVKQRNRILLVLFVGVFMAALDVAIVAPAIPALRIALGVDTNQIALFIIAYSLCALISTAPMASLSDRYGRRPIYLLNIVLFALGSLVVALAPSYGFALLGRAIQGVAAGGITPAASAVVGDVFPAEQRGKILGLLGATFGIAFLFGPLIASIILLALSWQWLFLVNLPVALLVIGLGVRNLPRSQPASLLPPFDLGGTLLGFVLLTSLTLAINRAVDQVLRAALWPWFALLALVSLPLLIWIERRAAQPIIPLSFFNTRQLKLTYLLCLGAGFAMGSVVFVTSIAVAAFAIPEQQAGFLMLPMVICSSTASVLFGRWLNRIGSRTVVLIGFGAVAGGSALLDLTLDVFWLFLVATMTLGVGVGTVVGGVLRYIVLNEATPQQRSTGQGLVNVGISIGNLLAVAVLGALADSQGGGLSGFALAYLVAAGPALLMLLLSLGLKGRMHEQQSLAIEHATT
jgi:MFS family permease